MKFVALALALLLAVGSHAASLQADAPSQLQHIRAILDMSLLQAKESAKRALDGLDGTEYAELKNAVNQRLDDLHMQINGMVENVNPVAESVVSTVVDATAELRASLNEDIKQLNEEIGPMNSRLRDTIQRHFNQYRERMGPAFKDLYTAHRAEMENIKTRMELLMENMKPIMSENVEETKAALVPIIEAVRAKLSVRLENLKELVTPYVEEYKTQIEEAIEQARSINPSELTALKAKIEPMTEDVKLKLNEIFETIAASFNKS